ncbi:hypothetical protein pb186bvf_009427 [Paramecium bursaria]
MNQFSLRYYNQVQQPNTKHLFTLTFITKFQKHEDPNQERFGGNGQTFLCTHFILIFHTDYTTKQYHAIKNNQECQLQKYQFAHIRMGSFES